MQAFHVKFSMQVVNVSSAISLLGHSPIRNLNLFRASASSILGLPVEFG